MNVFKRAARRIANGVRALVCFGCYSRSPRPAQPSDGKADFLAGLHSGPVYGKRKDKKDRERTLRVNRALGIPQTPRFKPAAAPPAKIPKAVQRSLRNMGRR